MIADAKRLFQRLGCRDYARIDFRCDAAGVPRLMEVNPNPAWAYDGKLALMAGFADIPYAEMLRMILNAAVARIVK
jgi:D-alanine-D-alanine ligase